MIKENIQRLRERILSACQRAGRNPQGISVVCVTKGRCIEEINEALSYGFKDIGENKLQEALLKYSDKRLARGDTPLNWHMLGHLQSNKAKEAVKIFDLIQSVDSLRLAELINKEAAEIGKVQDILIEVKTSAEEAKFGLKSDALPGFLEAAQKLKNIHIKGLMTIAALVDNAQKARPYFRRLKELKDSICDMRLATSDTWILSMGMTDDFEVAIEEGADIVRIGRAIFESQK